MRKGKWGLHAMLIFIACAAIFVTACSDGDSERSGGTFDEPEITVGYLSDEYAAQLLTDGAEYIFGTIDIQVDEEGIANLTIDAKEFVEDFGQANGFYIADKNMEYTYPLSTEARTTFLSGGTSIAKVMDAAEFVDAVEQDILENGANNPDYQETKLYEIYVMSGQIELILAKYI